MEALHQQLIPPGAPPPISWWPPAPGWWLIAGLLIAVLLLLPWLQRKARQRRQRRSHSMDIFTAIPRELPDNEWLAEINTRLKQLLKQRGDDAATRLHGEAWLDYLCAEHPTERRTALQPLATDLYRPGVRLSSEQRQALLRAVRHWMRHDHV